MVAVIPTSDTFASVLLGIPGSSASQATVLDGFPLAKKGQAARALSAAFISSLVGGIFGVLILTFLILFAYEIIHYIRSPAQFMLAVFGIALVGLLSGRSLLKGLLAAGMGIFFGLIGPGNLDGIVRLVGKNVEWLQSFSDFLALYFPADGRELRGPIEAFQRYLGNNGLGVAMIGLTMFAIPEITDLLRRDRPISESGTLGQGWRVGLQDWFRHKRLSLWNAFTGVLVGIVPGLGGSVVDWIAYGQTKALVAASGQDTSKFGHGDIRGVIGPESANNAKEGGGLIPTLLLGLPGSGSMAIFLGILGFFGLDAGLPMFQTIPLSASFQYGGTDLVVTGLMVTFFIAWTLMLANVMGTGLCFGLATPISHLTRIPFPILAPFLIVVLYFAIYKISGTIGYFSLLTFLGLGLLGVLMKRFRWSRPAFLIGFVLATPLETKFNFASQTLVRGNVTGVDIFLAGFILVCTLLALLVAMRLQCADRPDTRPAPAAGAEAEAGVAGFAGVVEPGETFKERLPFFCFVLFVAGLFLFALLEPLGYGRPIYSFGKNVTDAQMPHFLGLLMFPLALFGLFQVLWGRSSSSSFIEDEEFLHRRLPHTPLWQAYGWVVLYLPFVAVLGFLIGTAAYASLFFFKKCAFGSLGRTYLTLGLVAFFIFLCDLLNPFLLTGLLGVVLSQFAFAEPLLSYLQTPQFPFIPK